MFKEQAIHQRRAGQPQGVRIDNILVLACKTGETLNQRKHAYLTQSYQVTETPHFVVCQKAGSAQSIIMHVLTQSQVDADIICVVADELASCRVFTTAKTYGATLFAILASTCPAPRTQSAVWRLFCLNTLAKFQSLITSPSQEVPECVSHITSFARIYRRVFELCCGHSFLDVGTSFGFLPVLFAKNTAFTRIVGCDNEPDILDIARDLAIVTEVQRPTFTVQDLLDEDFAHVGRFDTVTAIHLLEHLTEQQLPVALAHLLEVTSHRLIVAVPYEETPQANYGHVQRFTPQKLDQWGHWCRERLNGHGRYWCEDVAGGMLIIELAQQEKSV